MLPAPGPLSACGRVIDYLRSCYRTRMRFGDDAESERWVRWQFVPPNTPLLDRPTVFGSIQWGFREPTSGPGEVVGSPRIYDRGAPLPWPYGAPPCGTDQEWAGGFGIGTLPELPLGPDGVPLCCTGPPEPVPTPQCPEGLPPLMFGMLENTQSPPGSIRVPFSLAHVPGSDPPRWVGELDWTSIGGSEVDALTWEPTGSGLNDMGLSSVGCMDFVRLQSALFGPQNCEEVEWWYAFLGVFLCAPPGFTELLYRIGSTPIE